MLVSAIIDTTKLIVYLTIIPRGRVGYEMVDS